MSCGFEVVLEGSSEPLSLGGFSATEEREEEGRTKEQGGIERENRKSTDERYREREGKSGHERVTTEEGGEREVGGSGVAGGNFKEIRL